MNPKVTTLSLSLLVAVALCAASVAADWTSTNLGTLGGSWSTALDINNRGQVVGATNGRNEDALLWSPDYTSMPTVLGVIVSWCSRMACGSVGSGATKTSLVAPSPSADSRWKS